MVRFGGHAQAVGLTVAPDRLESPAGELGGGSSGEWPAERFVALPRVRAGAGAGGGHRRAGGRSWHRLEPHGQGNPCPLLRVGPLRLRRRAPDLRQAASGATCRPEAEGGDGARVSLLAWGWGDRIAALAGRSRCWPTSESNRYDGRPVLRLSTAGPSRVEIRHDERFRDPTAPRRRALRPLRALRHRRPEPRDPPQPGDPAPPLARPAGHRRGGGGGGVDLPRGARRPGGRRRDRRRHRVREHGAHRRDGDRRRGLRAHLHRRRPAALHRRGERYRVDREGVVFLEGVDVVIYREDGGQYGVQAQHGALRHGGQGGRDRRRRGGRRARRHEAADPAPADHQPGPADPDQRAGGVRDRRGLPGHRRGPAGSRFGAPLRARRAGGDRQPGGAEPLRLQAKGLVLDRARSLVRSAGLGGAAPPRRAAERPPDVRLLRRGRAHPALRPGRRPGHRPSAQRRLGGPVGRRAPGGSGSRPTQ